MEKSKFNRKVLLFLLLASLGDAVYIRMSSFDLMKCSYGERGSLTATCVNATTTYFKNTPYRFDHLDETLRCVNCTLQTLESNSFDISGNHIKYLDLSHSQISLINTKAFVGLIFLQRLNLAYNEIKSIYPGTFSGVKKITDVNLEHNEMTILSDSGFQELIGLEGLSLRNNHIKSIATKAFQGLLNLKRLDLSFNEIWEVKGVFENMTSLQFLDLSYNKISTLSNESNFENLTSLVELRLNNNLITQIGGLEFTGMDNLRLLNLSFNLIGKVVAGSFKGLDTLENLDLSNNNLAQIPQKTFQSLHSLKWLSLSNNKLSIIQTGIYSGLPQLRFLNVSHNVIEYIEVTGVFSLDSLDTLDISYNNISYFDYIALISRLPKISYLNMENNLLGCDLDKEMDIYFAQDNFKFILYSNELGSVKCVENPTTPRPKHTLPQISLLQQGAFVGPSSAALIWIFVLIAFTIVSVGVLYYLQVRTYQEMKRLTGPPHRTISQDRLMSSDLEARDNDYFNNK